MSIARGVPVTIIRGGTSRGVFLRDSDLPADPASRRNAILRFFGGESAALADGLGGEHPVLRKAAIVSAGQPTPEGYPRVRYTFGQVTPDLRDVEHSAECGNIAAGIPIFSALEGFVPAPAVGSKIWIDLANTGKAILADWTSLASEAAGAIRLSFVLPATDRASALPLGEPASTKSARAGTAIRYSAVSAMNSYVFVDAASLGIPRPGELRHLPAETHQALADLVDEVKDRLGTSGLPKTCLVAPVEGRSATISALVVYPREQRVHHAFPVTGAVALGVASCLEGTVLHECARLGSCAELAIAHPSGVLSVFLDRGAADVPRHVGIERTFRVLMRGTGY